MRDEIKRMLKELEPEIAFAAFICFLTGIGLIVWALASMGALK